MTNIFDRKAYGRRGAAPLFHISHISIFILHLFQINFPRLIDEIPTEGLLKIRLGHYEVVDSLALLKTRLSQRELGIIHFRDRTFTNLVGLGGDVIGFPGQIDRLSGSVIAVHVGLHSIEILTDSYSQLPLGIDSLKVELNCLDLGLLDVVMTLESSGYRDVKAQSHK